MRERPSAPPAHPKRHSYNTASPLTFQAGTSYLYGPASPIDIDITKCNYSSAAHNRKPEFDFDVATDIYLMTAAREDLAGAEA
jgi:hypothetical protein